MCIWTTQTIAFWNQLQDQGVAFCDTAKSWGSGDMKEAYGWMAGQMTKRIGPPPRPEIVYPVWRWQQVGSYKKEYQGSFSDCGGDDDEFVFITAQIPDENVLLSDFDMWHHVLNHWCIARTKKEDTDDEEGIIKSWDLVFDLDTQHWCANRKHRNRWIQATFWELRLEWVMDSVRIRGYQRWLQQQKDKWGNPAG